MDMYASASSLRGLSAASVLEVQGSGNFSSHDGSLPSCSSPSSERNSTADLIDGAAEDIAILEDGEVQAMLQDAEVRAMLRKVTINEGVLNKAIQSLGGGEKGLKSLMEYIMVWVKQQRDIQSSSQQLPVPPPPSNPAWNFSTAHHVVLHPSSDAFQILSGILQPPPTTQVLDQEMRYTQRLKSRKLMTGKPELGAGLGGLDTGFCPSSFISSPEDCKPEVKSSDTMAPCIPQLNYGMQQQQPVTPFTSAHLAMPSIEPTPAMTSKAARRHRMTRQRQSFHARAASPVAAAPVSVGDVSLWNTNAATPLAVASSGISGVQTTPPRPVTAAWEGRRMEGLTVLLQKELRPSDVSHLGRIVLPKKAAEQRMPSLASREGVSILMEDFDSGHAWNLRYKYGSVLAKQQKPDVHIGEYCGVCDVTRPGGRRSNRNLQCSARGLCIARNEEEKWQTSNRTGTGGICTQLG